MSEKSLIKSYRLKHTETSKQRFSLRKFSVGTASVLVGTTLFFGTAVSANELNVDQPLTVQVDTVSESKEQNAQAEQRLKEAVSAEHTDKSVIESVTTAEKSLAETQPAEIGIERLAGITYKITYTDIETKQVIHSENHSISVNTTEEVAETKLAVTASPQAGYVLASGQSPDMEKVVREKESNLFNFNLVPNGEDRKKVTEGERFLATETPISNDKPYITIERYYGANRYRNKNYILTRNGDTIDVIYQMGLTRIRPEDVELTPDAKTLGLTYDYLSNRIVGKLVLDNRVDLRTYEIGLQKIGDPSVKTSADLTFQSHKGFVPRLDATYSDGTIPHNTSEDVSYGRRSVSFKHNSGFEYNVASASVRQGTGTAQTNGEFHDALGKPADQITYDGLVVTTTPFGFYVDNGTIADVKTNRNYDARFELFALDSRETFNTPLRVVSFEQTDASEGVSVEFIDKSALYPHREYNPHDGYDKNGSYHYGSQNTPYLVRFKNLPATAGEYFVAFKVVDNLGLEKHFRINFSTFERSQNGALTIADIRYQDNPDYLNAGVNRVVVPSSTDEQVLTTIVQNKQNATIKPIDLPAWLEYDAQTNQLKKKAGQRLTPGIYTVAFQAVDGHFNEAGPARTFTYEVSDVISEITHQIWQEGSVIQNIPVTLEGDAVIKTVKVVYNGNHAELRGNSDTRTIGGFALTPTQARETATVEVTYTNSQGDNITVRRPFTFEVTPQPIVNLDLNVTNADQTVTEGESFKDMVVTVTDGASLTVDKESLPIGVTYDDATKTFSGKGLYEGVYRIPIIAEKEGRIKSAYLNLTVKLGEFVVNPIVINATANTPFTEKVPLPEGVTLRQLQPDRSGSYENGYRFSNNNLVFNQELKTVNGKPISVGSYTIDVKARRRTRSGLVQEAVTTLTVNVAPLSHDVTISNQNQTLFVGENIQDMVIGMSEHATLDYSYVYNIPGLTYDSARRTISGRPTQVGTYTIDVVSRMRSSFLKENPDNYEDIVTKTITLTVRERDIAVTGGSQTVEVGQAITPLTLVHTDGSTLDVQLEGGFATSLLPEGVTYNKATKTFTGTPTRVGTYRIPVLAHYPDYSNQRVKSTEVVFTVTPKALDYTVENRVVDVKSAMTDIVLTPTSDSSNLVLTVNGLPEGLSFNPNTKTISGTPEIVGDYDVRIVGTYKGIHQPAVEKQLTIKVNPLTPVLSISNNNQTYTLGESIEPVVLSHSPYTTVTAYYLGLDLNENDISDYASKEWGLQYDPHTNTFSGIPKAAGTYQLRLKAKLPSRLGGGEVEELYKFTVLPETEIGLDISNDRQIVVLGDTIRLVDIKHSDNADIVIDTASLPEGLSYDARTQQLTGTPTKAGRYDILVTANEKAGQKSVTKTIALDVIKIPGVASSDPLLNILQDGASLVSGKGTPDAKVVVRFPDGSLSDMITVDSDGNWSVNTPSPLTLGQTITVRQTESGRVASDAINATVIRPVTEGEKGPKGDPGRDGMDGKSPTLTTERGRDEAGYIGHKIIITNPDGTETVFFVRDGVQGEKGDTGPAGLNGRDGQDGKSPVITSVAGQDEQGNQGHILTITNGDGSVTTLFVKDGKNGLNGRDGVDGQDGETSTLSIEEGVNQEGHLGIWFIVKDGHGQVMTKVFVRQCGCSTHQLNPLVPPFITQSETPNRWSISTVLTTPIILDVPSVSKAPIASVRVNDSDNIEHDDQLSMLMNSTPDNIRISAKAYGSLLPKTSDTKLPGVLALGMLMLAMSSTILVKNGKRD